MKRESEREMFTLKCPQRSMLLPPFYQQALPPKIPHNSYKDRCINRESVCKAGMDGL